MKRSDLLRNPGWWLAEIQNDLYAVIYEYMEKHHLKKKDIADMLGVSKGYVTQILSGNFDHKISKLVDLSLSFGKAPKISYVDLEKYISEDAKARQDHVSIVGDAVAVPKDTMKKVGDLNYCYNSKNSKVKIESETRKTSSDNFALFVPKHTFSLQYKQ